MAKSFGGRFIGTYLICVQLTPLNEEWEVTSHDDLDLSGKPEKIQNHRVFSKEEDYYEDYEAEAFQRRNIEG